MGFPVGQSFPQQGLFGILLVGVLISLSSAAEQPFLRRLQEPKPYYTGTPQEFLLEYGLHYHLFDPFFPTGYTVLQSLPSNRTRQSHDISTKFKIRDYKSWQTWQVPTSTPLPALATLTFSSKETNPEMILYNNRFRFGAGLDDRFTGVGFTKDPWTEDNAQISFSGHNVSLPGDREYVCEFSQPVVATSGVTVTREIRNIINEPTDQNVVKCAIPPSVVEALRAQNKGQEDEGEVVLTLAAVHNNQHIPLIPDIHVPRVYWLDRRRYKFVVVSMLDNLEDPMVREWITYNILLGVEHFIIYYNTKAPVVDITHSQLRPFLDANIVTLVYHPFSHAVFYANVQYSLFNYAMQVYGAYVEWMAFWDLDEFFLPTAEFLTYLSSSTAPYPLESVTMTLAPGGEPGIMFDTFEMACEPKDENFYLSPNPNRKAVTVFCNQQGFYFKELTFGHGKMLIRPSKVSYLHSPHRLTDYWVVWTTPQRGGSMKHFNNFRYTTTMMGQGRFSFQNIKADLHLKEFTLRALEVVMGVTAEYVKQEEAAVVDDGWERIK